MFNDNYELVCSKCGAVVLDGAESEAMLALTNQQEFLKHQTAKRARHGDARDWLNAQDWHIAYNEEPSTKEYLPYRDLVDVTEFGNSHWMVKEALNDVLVLYRRTKYDKVAPRAIVNFREFPERIVITFFIATSRGPGTKTFYKARRHTIEFSPATQRKLNDNVKAVLKRLIAVVLLELYADSPDSSRTRAFGHRHRLIANIIAHVLYRSGIIPKPFKWNKVRVEWLDVTSVKLDHQPLSGKKTADPLMMVKRRRPDKASVLKDAIDSAISQIKDSHGS